jgi:hypothetical protein
MNVKISHELHERDFQFRTSRRRLQVFFAPNHEQAAIAKPLLQALRK